MDPFTRDRANRATRISSEPESRQNTTPKGTTKTVSPKQSFKRKKRK